MNFVYIWTQKNIVYLTKTYKYVLVRVFYLFFKTVSL